MTCQLRKLGSGVDPADRKIVDRLADLAASWADSDKTARELVNELDRALGHSWFSLDALHSKAVALINGLRQAVDRIPGMTMDERLLTFGLLAAWDAASEESRVILRRKVETT